MTRCAASGGPNSQVAPSGAVSSTRIPSTGAGRPCTAKEKPVVRTASRATCRSRAVGTRVTPSASATSWPCAQVSMRRAVAIEVAAIGGPNQGSRVPSGTARSAVSSAARPVRHRASRSVPGAAAPASASRSTTSSAGRPEASSACTAARNRSGSVAASVATSSVQARWAIWCATVQPGAGVADRQVGPVAVPASRPAGSAGSAGASGTSATSVSRSAHSARRSVSTSSSIAHLLRHGAVAAPGG
nr:hypothetical protein [Kineosporia sp. R_H_3]